MCDCDKKAISSTIFMGKNNFTPVIYVKCLHKQVQGFRIFLMSLLRCKIAYVGVVTLRSRDGVAAYLSISASYFGKRIGHNVGLIIQCHVPPFSIKTRIRLLGLRKLRKMPLIIRVRRRCTSGTLLVDWMRSRSMQQPSQSVASSLGCFASY